VKWLAAAGRVTNLPKSEGKWISSIPAINKLGSSLFRFHSHLLHGIPVFSIPFYLHGKASTMCGLPAKLIKWFNHFIHAHLSFHLVSKYIDPIAYIYI
jgi:hypothetical protein